MPSPGSKWLLDHAQDLPEGEWCAATNEELVAHHTDFVEVAALVQQRGYELEKVTFMFHLTKPAI
ncbi:MAG: hypothetical protein C5B50_05670 [Verrucomicrobia bacterium]|nr:MAG: hypothetical protein C5B50_05670 [Verrucomicrobiota bacterium]